MDSMLLVVDSVLFNRRGKKVPGTDTRGTMRQG
jgi:hypothetical protein